MPAAAQAQSVQQSPAIGRAGSESVAYSTWRTLDLPTFGWELVVANRPLLEINVV